MKRLAILCVVNLCLVLAAAPALTTAADPDAPARPDAAAKVSYARDVKPILSGNCFTCHGPDPEQRKAKLRLDSFEDATKTLRGGGQAVVPGHPERSELVARIYAEYETELMPPPGTKHTLKPQQKELLKKWIEQGAGYEKHWAFEPVRRPEPPRVAGKGWAKNPVDLFTLARMQEAGLSPAPEADRYTLARRAAIDLTGLPPTLDLADRFVNDQSPDAYERYVDELLSLPGYGERWAAVWLDLARYADSSGYAEDNPRVIWMYRDWVVRAINSNMPFDRFTVEQLAGDMLPGPTEDQLIATAFHRNTLTNDEGGTSDEEFRVAAVVDRVNTTMQVWMGLTMGCAQCHNHKYDPLTQREYFQLYAVFNQTEDSDKRDLSPTVVHYTEAEQGQRADLEKQIADLRGMLDAPGADKGKLDGEVKALEKKLAAVAGVRTPVMRELPANRQRTTKVHIRGNFLNEGEAVGPGVPAVFPPIPAGRPVNRLTLAEWLVSADNPLTPRVTVNRYWEQVFGKGLVTTSEDFGVRGSLPTHPDLLDWLARDFVEHGWDVKHLLRRIVTSATYRQSSRVTPEMLAADPENLYYARAPRYRSSAEVIRDQALFAAGLLSGTMFGPPVNPPRPNFGLRAAFGGNTDWQDSQGEDRHRRALYTQWRRSMPYPSMATFDAPNRNVCTVARPRTNTPLQALVTMNDPVYVEAAQALARRVLKEGGKTDGEKAAYAFRLALTRPPQDRERDRLAALYRQAREEYSKNPQAARRMAADPLGPLPQGVDAAEAAAWTVVGNVVLNLDEVFQKR